MKTFIGWSLVVVALALAAVMALFAFTPLAWRLAGSPDESYPEILFVAVGLPSAVVALAAALLALWSGTRARPVLTVVYRLAGLLALIPGLLLLTAVLAPMAWLADIPSSAQTVLLLGWPVLAVALVVLLLVGFFTRPRGD
jgi:hypothetical protein